MWRRVGWTVGVLLVLSLGGAAVPSWPGMMPAGIPQLSSETQRQADRAMLMTEMRVGKVVSYNTATISVLIGGAVIPNCAFGRSYQPVLGDYVILMHQGSQWYVVDSLAGNPPTNAIINPTFENDAPGTAPSGGWGKYNLYMFGFTSSTLFVGTVPGAQHINGDKSLTIEWVPGGVGLGQVNDYIYSPPFAVVPGETWSVSAFVKLDGAIPQNFYEVNIGLSVAWFSDSTTVYPTTVAPDEPIAQDNMSLGPAWYRIGALGTNPEGITVPVGATYARMLLWSQAFFDGTETTQACLGWDLPIAIKIKNADGTYAP